MLVYIHGGIFRIGSGNGFGPHNFMDAGPMVVVTFNYRLGVFGKFESVLIRSVLERLSYDQYHFTFQAFLVAGTKSYPEITH